MYYSQPRSSSPWLSGSQLDLSNTGQEGVSRAESSGLPLSRRRLLKRQCCIPFGKLIISIQFFPRQLCLYCKHFASSASAWSQVQGPIRRRVDDEGGGEEVQHKTALNPSSQTPQDNAQ